MQNKNFLKETLQSLQEFHLTETDVISVGNEKYRISWECFKKMQTLNMTQDSEDNIFDAT